MIKELAEYEKDPAAVVATEESLARTLTFAPSARPSNPGYAKTLLIRLPANPSPRHPDDKPSRVAGMALYFNSYSTWRSKPGIYLEDLFVREEYRGRGYGKMLIQELAREVLQIDGARLEWSCLKWNTPSMDFYKKLGAVEQEEWTKLRVDGEALERLALWQVKNVQRGRVNSAGTNWNPEAHGRH